MLPNSKENDMTPDQMVGWSIGHDNGETVLIHDPCDAIVSWFDGGSLSGLIDWLRDETAGHACDGVS